MSPREACCAGNPWLRPSSCRLKNRKCPLLKHSCGASSRRRILAAFCGARRLPLAIFVAFFPCQGSLTRPRLPVDEVRS
eukprot:03549_4